MPELRVTGGSRTAVSGSTRPTSVVGVSVRHQSRGQDLFWQATFAIRNTLIFGVIVAFFTDHLDHCRAYCWLSGGWFDRALMTINDVVVALPIFPILVLIYFVMRNDLMR